MYLLASHAALYPSLARLLGSGAELVAALPIAGGREILPGESFNGAAPVPHTIDGWWIEDGAMRTYADTQRRAVPGGDARRARDLAGGGAGPGCGGASEAGAHRPYPGGGVRPAARPGAA